MQIQTKLNNYETFLINIFKKILRLNEKPEKNNEFKKIYNLVKFIKYKRQKYENSSPTYRIHSFVI